jgi:ubiquinone/menaquinone biosynthesis C-methylase UbiE
MKENVKEHYERWPFPGSGFLSREGLLLLKYLNQWLGTEVKDKADKEVPSFIDVGCGTGDTIIALARHFPGVRFLGVDISASSLDTARRQAEDAGVNNVTFEQSDIRSGLAHLGRFRVVMCTGVLHHIKDMAHAFKQVVRLVRQGGCAVLWFYGRFGRQKHQLNRLFLEELTKNLPPAEALSIAHDFLEHLGSRFAVNSGFYSPKGSGEEGVAWLLEHPPWLADQMIPAFEQSVTMKDILILFKQNNLQFFKWLGVSTHLKTHTLSPRLLERFDTLSFHEQLLAIDYLIKPEYYFVVGKSRSQVNSTAAEQGA